jgi:hypothetical protein
MQPWYVMIFHENHLPNRKLILETSPQPKKHVPWGKLTLGISDRFCGASWMRGAAGLTTQVDPARTPPLFSWS